MQLIPHIIETSILYIHLRFYSCILYNRRLLYLIAACTDGQFACVSGKCVDDDAVCNGNYDCPDESDEYNCDSTRM